VTPDKTTRDDYNNYGNGFDSSQLSSRYEWNTNFSGRIAKSAKKFDPKIKSKIQRPPSALKQTEMMNAHPNPIGSGTLSEIRVLSDTTISFDEVPSDNANIDKFAKHVSQVSISATMNSSNYGWYYSIILGILQKLKD
jgi:hypothetical protein